jgi:hypothetical protein
MREKEMVVRFALPEGMSEQDAMILIRDSFGNFRSCRKDTEKYVREHPGYKDQPEESIQWKIDEVEKRKMWTRQIEEQPIDCKIRSTEDMTFFRFYRAAEQRSKEKDELLGISMMRILEDVRPNLAQVIKNTIRDPSNLGDHSYSDDWDDCITYLEWTW